MDGQKESKGRKRENWAFEEEMMLSLGGEFSLHRPLPWGPRMEEIDAKGERFCQEQQGDTESFHAQSRILRTAVPGFTLLQWLGYKTSIF